MKIYLHLGTLHEDIFTFIIISCQILLVREMFQIKVAEKIKTHFMFSRSFPKILPFMR
jgi:hypothetical protein